MRYETFTDLPLQLEPPTFFSNRVVETEQMSYDQLLNYGAAAAATSNSCARAAADAAPFVVASAGAVAFPFVAIIMTLIAVPFATSDRAARRTLRHWRRI